MAQSIRSFFVQALFSGLAFFLFAGVAIAQQAEGCEQPGRYLLPVFNDVMVTNVPFGTNQTATGQTKLLTMDVYQPVGDMAQKRPVIVWVHGGSFIFGSRNDMRNFAEAYARLGYVTASIDYRLFPLTLGIPDSVQALDAAIKAVGDLKAAVRHFRKDADTDNRFRIDPDRIIIGGLSAGAITALHAAYLTEEDEIPAHVQQVLDANGGIEGSSGDAQNMSYSSEAIAVINLSGALYRPEWISPSDPPLVSFHAKDDDVVPYLSDFARIGGIDIIRLNGSGVLHERAENAGLLHYLLGTETGGHTGIYTDPAYEAARAEFTFNATTLLRDIICEEVTVSTRDLDRFRTAAAYPTPATDAITVEWTGKLGGNECVMRLTDLQGRTIRQIITEDDGLHQLERDGLPDGIYLLTLQDRRGSGISLPIKVVFH